jgi:hypothetical protein
MSKTEEEQTRDDQELDGAGHEMQGRSGAVSEGERRHNKQQDKATMLERIKKKCKKYGRQSRKLYMKQKWHTR